MGEYLNAAGGRNLDAIFTAMADPSRRAILARLAAGEARVTEVASEFTISLNSVSKHIKMLERAGLVEREVRGRDHVLTLNAAPLEDAAAWIDHYRNFWEERLAALDAFVTAKRSTRKRSKPDA
jgi:DNA-binding transcriptional ArsR family regulator